MIQLHQFCLDAWAKVPANYCEKLPKMFAPSQSLKGSSSNSTCNLLTIKKQTFFTVIHIDNDTN